MAGLLDMSLYALLCLWWVALLFLLHNTYLVSTLDINPCRCASQRRKRADTCDIKGDEEDDEYEDAVETLVAVKLHGTNLKLDEHHDTMDPSEGVGAAQTLTAMKLDGTNLGLDESPEHDIQTN